MTRDDGIAALEEVRISLTAALKCPTFNGASLSIETHLLDFSGEVTARHLELHFWKRLREEKKFPTPEHLRAQIAQDIASARRFFTRLRRYHTARQTPVRIPD